MLTITNPKIGGLTAVWAPYRGFSLLFDNPGRALAEAGAVRKIDCRSDAPELALYQRLARVLAELGGAGRLTGSYGFFALPPASYHVTACDGVSRSKTVAIPASHRPALEALIDALPASIADPPACLDFFVEAAGDLASPILFKFHQLSIWGYAMVAELAPAEGSDAALKLFVTRRAPICARLEELNVDVRHKLQPHVTLGYFCNEEHAELASPERDSWSNIFAEGLGTQTISFTSVGFYGFTDMASFFRR